MLFKTNFFLCNISVSHHHSRGHKDTIFCRNMAETLHDFRSYDDSKCDDVIIIPISKCAGATFIIVMQHIYASTLYPHTTTLYGTSFRKIHISYNLL